MAGAEACQLEVDHLNEMIDAFARGSFGLCSMSSVTSTPTSTATSLEAQHHATIEAKPHTEKSSTSATTTSVPRSSTPARGIPELLPITSVSTTLPGATGDGEDSSRNSDVIWVSVLIVLVVASLLAGVIAAVQYYRPSSVDLDLTNRNTLATSPEVESVRYRYPSPEGYIDVAGHAPQPTNSAGRQFHVAN